jgi:hypothetical protein
MPVTQAAAVSSPGLSAACIIFRPASSDFSSRLDVLVGTPAPYRRPSRGRKNKRRGAGYARARKERSEKAISRRREMTLRSVRSAHSNLIDLNAVPAVAR